MTKRYYIIFFIVSLIIVAASSYIKVSEKRMMAGPGKAYNAENVQQLVKDSTLIVVGQVKEKKENIKANKISYAVSEVEVQEILKGNMLLSSETINLMQLGIKQDPEVKSGEKVLLFLEPYGDSSIENSYVCVGLGQGCYSLKNKEVIPAVSIPYSLRKSIEAEENIVDYIKLQAAVAQE